MLALCMLAGCGESAADRSTASLHALQVAVAPGVSPPTNTQPTNTSVRLSPELVDLIRAYARTREVDTASANALLAELATDIDAAGPRSLRIDVTHSRTSEGMGLLLVERARVGGAELSGIEFMALSQMVIECTPDDPTIAAPIARAMVLGLDPGQLQQNGRISEAHSIPYELGIVVRRDPAITSEQSRQVLEAMSQHRASFEAWFDQH
jgi:hypothetical protein